MFIVKRRSELVRFVLFVLLVALMAWYVSAKVGTWRATSAPAEGQSQPAAGPTMTPLDQGGARGQKLSSGGEDFFAEARIEREQTRSALREAIKQVLEAPGADPDAKKDASRQFLDIERAAALERQAETAVRGRGYQDVVVALAEDSAQVYVRARSISLERAMEVRDAVAEVTKVKPAKVKVAAREK